MAATTKVKPVMSKNQQGVRAMAKVMSIIILVLGVIYCEVMYLSVVSIAFPPGLLRVFASIGAVVGGLSVLLLLLAKSYWFTEGVQLIFSYVFTGIEVLALIVNILVAFSLNDPASHPDAWIPLLNQYISPVTPVLAIVGWTIIWALDSSSKRRHTQTNIEDEQHTAELEYNQRVFEARNDLRHSYLTQIISDMREDMSSEHIRAQGRVAASQLAADALSEVTGMPISPRLSGSNTPLSLPNSVSNKIDNAVDADPGSGAKGEPVLASFAQTADVEVEGNGGKQSGKGRRRKVRTESEGDDIQTK